MSWYGNPYLCATQGHIVRGQGWGTGPGQTVWASHCERCGAKVGPLPPIRVAVIPDPDSRDWPMPKPPPYPADDEGEA